MADESVDVIVIGGGPGGLTAALYLARFNRSVLLIEDGRSRAAMIGRSHNYPTYASGLAGEEILNRLGEQIAAHGARRLQGEVTSIASSGEDFEVRTATERHRARAVILATGVTDTLPAIEGLHAAIWSGRVGLCPVCHAYESNGRTVAVLTDAERGIEEAEFLMRHAREVTVLDMSRDGLGHAMPPDSAIRHLRVGVEDIEIGPASILCRTAAGEGETFEQLYCALGKKARSGPAGALGARLNAEGCILVDAFQETSVRNLFAVGDVVKGLDQIVVAEGEAAIAASHLNLRLAEADRAPD